MVNKLVEENFDKAFGEGKIKKFFDKRLKRDVEYYLKPGSKRKIYLDKCVYCKKIINQDQEITNKRNLFRTCHHECFAKGMFNYMKEKGEGLIMEDQQGKKTLIRVKNDLKVAK